MRSQPWYRDLNCESPTVPAKSYWVICYSHRPGRPIVPLARRKLLFPVILSDGCRVPETEIRPTRRPRPWRKKTQERDLFGREDRRRLV